MVKHIVMWKFKPEVTPAQQNEMKRRLEALLGVVPSLKTIEVGLDESKKPAAMDMVLLTTFNTFEDLNAYAIHPAHQKVVAFVKPLVLDRAVVDFC